MFEDIFGTTKPLIGVVHLLPLPGSARWDGQFEPIYERAEQEALALSTGGVNGLIVENFFDAPYTKGRLDPATVCAFTVAVKRIMALCELPIGINCLRNDGKTALAIAAVTGAQFIRINVLSGALLTDQGIVEGEAHELLLYRRHLQAQKSIKIFADILVKHAISIGAEQDLEIVAQDTYLRSLADALIISGERTGLPPNLSDIIKVKAILPDCPILVGSGANKENIQEMIDIADGAIVASFLKRGGLFDNPLDNPIDPERVRSFIKASRVK